MRWRVSLQTHLLYRCVYVCVCFSGLFFLYMSIYIRVSLCVCTSGVSHKLMPSCELSYNCCQSNPANTQTNTKAELPLSSEDPQHPNNNSQAQPTHQAEERHLDPLWDKSCSTLWVEGVCQSFWIDSLSRSLALLVCLISPFSSEVEIFFCSRKPPWRLKGKDKAAERWRGSCLQHTYMKGLC